MKRESPAGTAESSLAFSVVPPATLSKSRQVFSHSVAKRNYLDGSSFRMKVNCFLLSKELMDFVLLFSFWYLAQTW